MVRNAIYIMNLISGLWAQQELQTLRAKSDEKAKADAETLAAETKNKEAAMRIKAKTNLDRAASLIVERIVNG